LRKSEERLDVGVGEGIITGERRLLNPCGLQPSGEEFDMSVLILGDLLKDGIDSRVTSLSESGIVELLESLRVESVFEMFEDESEGEDGSVVGCRRRGGQ